MQREHNISVRKHLHVSFPATAELLKVSGTTYRLIVYLFQLLYLIFFAENSTPLWRGKYAENSFASFPEMLCSYRAGDAPALKCGERLVGKRKRSQLLC